VKPLPPKPPKPEAKPRSASASKPSFRDDDLDDLDDAMFEDADLDIEPIARTPGAPPPDAKPNPVELPAPINPEGGRKQSVEMHRNLFCVHYDHCLDEAVKKSWNSFTCVRCAFYHTGNEEVGSVERFATQRRQT